MYSSFWEMIAWRQPPQVLYETRDESTLVVNISKKKDKYFIDGKRASHLQCIEWFANHGSASDKLIMLEVEATKRKKMIRYFGEHLLVIGDQKSLNISKPRGAFNCGYFIVSDGKARIVDRKCAEEFIARNPTRVDYSEKDKFMRGERYFA